MVATNPITEYLKWIDDPNDLPFPEQCKSISPQQILALAQDDPAAGIKINAIVNNPWLIHSKDITERLAKLHKANHTKKVVYVKPKKPEVTKPSEEVKEIQAVHTGLTREEAELVVRDSNKRSVRYSDPVKTVLPNDIDDYMLVNIHVDETTTNGSKLSPDDPSHLITYSYKEITSVDYVLRNGIKKLIVPSDDMVDLYYGQDDYLNVSEIKRLKKKRIHFQKRRWEIKNLKDQGYAVYAADIPLAIRKSVEWKQVHKKENHYPLRVASVDIELYQDGYGIVDFTNVESSAQRIPVNLISIWDSQDDVYYTLVYNINHNSHIDVSKIPNYLDYKDEKLDVRIFETEQELFMEFFKIMRELDPDVAIGWNTSEFDWPYIKYRCDRLGIPPQLAHGKKLSVEYKVSRNKYGQDVPHCIPYLGYTVDLDYMRCYRERSLGVRENYRLNTIAMYELGIEKLDTEEGMDKIFREEPERFIAYNINDVHLVRKLDEKLKYIDLCFMIVRLCNVSWKSIYTTLHMCDGLIYEKLLESGRTIKCLDKKEAADKRGGYVRNPIVGFHEYVGDLDATSMYPYIMCRFNISADTYVGRIEDERLAHMYLYDRETFLKQDKFHLILRINGVNTTFKPSPQGFCRAMDKSNYIITHVGTIFLPHETRLSVLYEIIDMLITLRKEYKNKMKEYLSTDRMLYDRYDISQKTVKVITNSLYGAQANENFRLYSKEVAESITGTGREIIRLAAFMANQYIDKIAETKQDISTESIPIDPEWPSKSEGVLPNVIYGDSVVGSSVIPTSKGSKKIEQIWEDLSLENGTYSLLQKDYILNPNLKVLNSNGDYIGVKSIMKHKVHKKMFKISDDYGNSVIVTEDHSIMVLRDGALTKVKPSDILSTDRLIILEKGGETYEGR